MIALATILILIVALIVFIVFFNGLNVIKSETCPKHDGGDCDCAKSTGLVPTEGDTVQMRLSTTYSGFAIVPDDKAPYPMTVQGKVCKLNGSSATVEWEAVWNDKYPEVVWWAYKEEKDWKDKLIGSCGVNPTIDWGLTSTVDIKRLYIPQYIVRS